jgi:hypothetical protein
MPFVPYAVSLALSVEYRKMRHSRLPMFRARARAAFKSNCELLRRFGDVFWSARVVAGLGERVLREMERTANSLANNEVAPSMPPPSLLPSQPTVDVDANPLANLANAAAAARMSEPVDPSGAAIGTPAAAVDPAAVAALDALDLSLFDAMPDLDVFGHFDPNFNLDAVDDALEANLDIGLPLNWGDWDQPAG